MMKIKKKVEMNLHELIKWAWDEDNSGDFISSYGGEVSIDLGGTVDTLRVVDNMDIFTVDVEEEVTEKTNIPNLLEVYKNDFGNLGAQLHQDKTIKDVLKLTPSRFKIEKFYIINDDMTMTLIWRDGELIK